MPLDINGNIVSGSSIENFTINNEVITDGLILHLDGNYKHSCPGGGTTWYDLSGVIGDVNIQNRNTDWSFQKDPTSGQLCIFNSTNRTGNTSGINIPNNNGFNKVEGTFEAWLKPSGDHTGGHGWFNNSDGTDYTNADNWFWIGTWDTSNAFYFRQGNPGFCCNDVSFSSFRQSWYPLDVWYHWTVTWNVAAGRGAVYRDATVVSSRSNLPTNIPNTNPTTSAQMFNGHTRGDNMQFKGYCNLYKLYNRELTSTEVIQNYNATKSRFRI